MTWENILTILIVIGVGYYLLKYGKNLIVIGILGLSILFTSLFVLRDMLHIPVNNYVDVSWIDRLKMEGVYYIDSGVEKTKNMMKDAKQTKNMCTREEIAVSYKGVDHQQVKKSYVIELNYKDLNEKKRLEVYESLREKISDTRFKEKLLGMNPYVDIRYDLGNAEMFNSSDHQKLIIKFK